MSETRKQYFLSILYEDEKSFLENLLFIEKLYKGIFIFARKREKSEFYNENYNFLHLVFLLYQFIIENILGIAQSFWRIL